VKLGLIFANTGVAVTPDGAEKLARIAEEQGFESVWTVEHVVIPAGYGSTYPYSSSGRMPGGEDPPITDPLIWLSFVAAKSERLVLGTGIMILPQRNPVITAKALATLDVLSGGRLRLGVGIGWLREEFDAIGVPFEERAARTEEAIEVMRTLWREDQPSYEGRFWTFEDARCWPKPVNRKVPIIVGGHGEPAARRAGRLGDGFFPGNRDHDEIGKLITLMRQTAEDAGRDPANIEVMAGAWPDAAAVERFASFGVDRLVVPAFAADIEQLQNGIEKAAEAFHESGVAVS
jgi:probable F420-dependent oxidoreductase